MLILLIVELQYVVNLLVFLYSIILAWIFWLLLLLEVLDAAGCCTAGAGFFFFKLCWMFMIIYYWLLMYMFAIVNFFSVNTSFNSRCPNLIMHLAYYIDLNFYSLFLCILKIARCEAFQIYYYYTDIYLRLIRKVKLKKNINLLIWLKNL